MKKKTNKDKQKEDNNKKQTVDTTNAYAGLFLDSCHFCIFFLPSVSVHSSSDAVGLVSHDSLDIRSDVRGIILKDSFFSLFFQFFLKTQSWNTTCEWKHPHLCGQRLDKPSLSSAIRPPFRLSPAIAPLISPAILPQTKELFFRYLFAMEAERTF